MKNRSLHQALQVNGKICRKIMLPELYKAAEAKEKAIINKTTQINELEWWPEIEDLLII